MELSFYVDSQTNRKQNSSKKAQDQELTTTNGEEIFNHFILKIEGFHSQKLKYLINVSNYVA